MKYLICQSYGNDYKLNIDWETKVGMGKFLQVYVDKLTCFAIVIQYSDQVSLNGNASTQTTQDSMN